MRIGRDGVIFDMNGCHLFTGATLGLDDPLHAQSALARAFWPPLWDDWREQTLVDAWPDRRSVLVVNASNVVLMSSYVGARIQGANRLVHYRGSPELVGRTTPTGAAFYTNPGATTQPWMAFRSGAPAARPSIGSPAWVDAEIIAPTMRSVEIGIHTLGMMPCAGANGPIDDLVLENIVSCEVPSVDRYPNGSASTDFRSENWRLENIVCPSGVKPQVGPVFRVPGIDGIQVLDCHVPVQGTAVGVQTDTGLTGPAGPSTRVRINPAASVQFPFSP